MATAAACPVASADEFCDRGDCNLSAHMQELLAILCSHGRCRVIEDEADGCREHAHRSALEHMRSAATIHSQVDSAPSKKLLFPEPLAPTAIHVSQ